jgi:type I restriction enzyme R subunit
MNDLTSSDYCLFLHLRSAPPPKSVASKADTIAHRTKKTISERMDDDPAFYAKFSKMLEDAIAAFQQKRLAEIEYL